MAKRLVVLVSGSGTNLQALLDEIASVGAEAYGAEVVAVGADRDGIEGLARAERAGLPTFVCRVKDHPDREAWDAALTEAVAAHQPDLVVSAGFMKIVGKAFLARFGGRFVNTHPALLPSFSRRPRRPRRARVRRQGHRMHRPLRRRRRRHRTDHRPGRGRGPGRGRRERSARAHQGSRAKAARRGRGASRP
ncbi:hypothetical protein GCM10020256_28780 [Streptomyces thermocoprophilus]